MKLGDLAYYVFRPFVYVIDWTWDTDMRHCEKCKLRRKKWNALPGSRWWAIFIVTLAVGGVWWWVK